MNLQSKYNLFKIEVIGDWETDMYAILLLPRPLEVKLGLEELQAKYGRNSGLIIAILFLIFTI